MFENTVHLAIGVLRYNKEVETDRAVIAAIDLCIRMLEMVLEIGPISDNELQGGLTALAANLSEGGEGDE